MMRTDPRYTRVRAMLTAPEVPRHGNGGILLCHLCQRWVYFRGGLLELLTRTLEREAAIKVRMWKIKNGWRPS